MSKNSADISAKDYLLYALDHVNDGITIFDADDRLITCNEKYKSQYDPHRDVVVPGAMNDPDLAAEFRSRSPTTKIVYMTGYAEDAFNNYAEPDELTHVIQKPFKKADLASMIRSVLDAE